MNTDRNTEMDTEIDRLIALADEALGRGARDEAETLYSEAQNIADRGYVADDDEWTDAP